MPYHLPVLSYSGLSTYQSCARKYKYTYIDDRRQDLDGEEAIRIGSAFHKAIELWTPESCDKALEAAPTPQVRGMIWAYHKDRSQRNFRPLHHEVEFSVDISGVQVRGFIDAIAEYEGRLVAVERKTTGMALDTYVEMKTFDWQPTMYYAACKKLGMDIDVIILDVVGRQRQNKRETGPEFEKRIADTCPLAFEPLWKTERDLETFERDFLSITHLLEQDLWPRNPGSCFKFNKKCEFFADCANG